MSHRIYFCFIILLCFNEQNVFSTDIVTNNEAQKYTKENLLSELKNYTDVNAIQKLISDGEYDAFLNEALDLSLNCNDTEIISTLLHRGLADQDLNKYPKIDLAYHKRNFLRLLKLPPWSQMDKFAIELIKNGIYDSFLNEAINKSMEGDKFEIMDILFERGLVNQVYLNKYPKIDLAQHKQGFLSLIKLRAHSNVDEFAIELIKKGMYDAFLGEALSLCFIPYNIPIIDAILSRELDQGYLDKYPRIELAEHKNALLSLISTWENVDKIVIKLIDRGTYDLWLNEALISSIPNRGKDIIVALVNRGADPETILGRSSGIFAATMHKKWDLVDLFCRHCHARKQHNEKYLLSLMEDDKRIDQFILELIDSGKYDPYINEALSLSFEYRTIKVIEALINRGADVNWKNFHDQNQLELAREVENGRAIQLLLKNGAVEDSENLHNQYRLKLDYEANDLKTNKLFLKKRTVPKPKK